MATAKTILKLTNTEAIVKIAGTAASETITLDVDLLMAANEQLITTANGYPANIPRKVNLAAVVCTGAPNGIATIVRNGATLYTIQSSTMQMLDLQGDPFIPDAIQNDQSIVVTLSGAQTEVLLYLKKVAGYKSTDALSTQNS